MFDNLKEINDIIANVDTIKISDLDKHNTLMLSIDMNNGFVKKGALASNDVLNIIPETVKVFNALKQIDIPIIAYTDTHDKDSIEFNSYPVHCLANDVESKIVDELIPFIDMTIPKTSTNGFLAYNPLDYKKDLSTILLSGCCTDICIYQFAITLKTYLVSNNLNVDVVVCKNLCETFNAPGHNKDLYNNMFFMSMLNNGIKVMEIK